MERSKADASHDEYYEAAMNIEIGDERFPYLPVEVKTTNEASTVTVTAFSVLEIDFDTCKKVVDAEIAELNQMANYGYYIVVPKDGRLIIKYVQKLILFDSNRKCSAIEKAIGDAIIHLRGAAYTLIKMTKKEEITNGK